MNIFNNFKYLQKYYSLPVQIEQKLGVRGITYINGFTIYCHLKEKYVDCYQINRVMEEINTTIKFKFSILEAFHSFCLEL